MTHDSLIGIQLDEYRLEALLGRGGMARVYRAVDVRLNRYAAIKVIDTPFRADPVMIRRFEREAQAVAQIDHPHVVRLYRYGDVTLGDTRLLYLAMQYIPGADLGYVIDSYRRDREWMEPQDVLRITREVGAALDAIHAAGIIHRDVKPSNIMLAQDGRAVLADFGLAMLQPAGTLGEVFGTPSYIAPEQARSSADAVPASDLYALGVVLYEMLTGQVPFHAPTPLDVAMQHVSTPPPAPRSLRPELSEALEAVLLKALAKQTAARYPSGFALAAALEAALEQSPGLRTGPGAAPAAPTRPAPVPTRSLPERVEEGSLLRPPAADPAPGAAFPPTFRPSGPPDSAPAAGAPATAGGTNTVALRVFLGVAGVLFFLCLILFGLALARRAGDPASRASATLPALPASGYTATPAPAVPTPVASFTTPAAEAPAPAGEGFALRVARCREEGCIVLINEGNRPVTLNLLRLESKESAARGEEWGVAEIPPGGCVRAVKDEEWANRMPEGVECSPVGHTLVREGRERFWKDGFEVTYNGRSLGECKKNRDSCVFE